VLADVAALLRCPHCQGTLALRERVLRCSHGHSFDVARQGYVNLLPRPAVTGPGDTAVMVRARESFLSGGHYDRLADAVAGAVNEAGCQDEPMAEVGAGTAYYLARALDDRTGPGVALDVSVAAARRAARAHPRVGSVVADAWTRLPLADGCLGAALVAFAPRSGGELARVVRPAGHVVVLVPATDHLVELRSTLSLLDVDPRKSERLAASLGADFAPLSERPVRWTASLRRSDVHDLVLMGPNAFHQTSDLDERIAALPERLPVTISGVVHVLRRR
jgi:SAM-dependent methyltransferase